jgi:hypothetical protein
MANEDITRIPFANGTILPQPRPYDEDLTNFGVSGADLTGRDVTSDDIFQDVYTQAFDASRPYGKKKLGGLEFMVPSKRMQLDLGDTLGGGIHNIKLDTPQGYQSNIRHGVGTSLVRDAVAKYFDPDSTSMTPWGEDKKMRDPNLFARIAGNVIAQGAGFANEGFGMNFFQNPKQTYEDLLANWSAKETNYFTSPEQKAKTLANYFSTAEGYIPNKLAEMAGENWRSFNRQDLAKNTIQPDGSLMTMGPNFNYGNAEADEMPINNITSSRILPEKKTLDTSRFKNMYWGPSSEEEGEVTTQEGIPGTTNWQKFLSKITRQPYRGAARPAGGYTPAQLNSMNALGGYYSEPARQQRSERKRVANMLARQAAGKSYSQANLNRLTMGSRPGHYDPPGGGGAAADTSPSTPGNNPFGYDLGGLATMFERRR